MPLEREPQTGRNLPIQGKFKMLPNPSSTGQRGKEVAVGASSVVLQPQLPHSPSCSQPPPDWLALEQGRDW